MKGFTVGNRLLSSCEGAQKAPCQECCLRDCAEEHDLLICLVRPAAAPWLSQGEDAGQDTARLMLQPYRGRHGKYWARSAYFMSLATSDPPCIQTACWVAAGLARSASFRWQVPILTLSLEDNPDMRMELCASSMALF